MKWRRSASKVFSFLRSGLSSTSGKRPSHGNDNSPASKDKSPSAGVPDATRRFQLAELHVGRVTSLKTGGAFELADYWEEGAVPVVRRAEIAQSRQRLRR